MFRFVGLFKYAANVKMSYKGVKLNPFEVLITGWRCFVWFLKPFQLFFFFFEAVNVYRKQESYVDFCHLTTYTQCKPNLFNLSLIQKKKEELKKKNKTKEKEKGKKIKNTQTFTTWQFSLQTQYNYTHIIPVWLCSLS